MKKVILICLLVFSLCACEKPNNNDPNIQESEKTNEVVGVVKKLDLSEDDIIHMEENWSTRFKYDFKNAELVELELYDDSYIYAIVNVYAYIDNEWKDNGKIIFDDEYPLKYLFMDFNIDLSDINHKNKLKFLSYDDEKNSTFSFIIDNQNFKEAASIGDETFMNSDINLYNDREVILYKNIKSKDEKELSTINSLYFDDFLAHKDLAYDSGIIVTLKVSDERPKNQSPKILINDSQSLMEYINLKGVDYLDWQDFEHLEYEDVGSGMIVRIYELEDAKLNVIGRSFDEKPDKIVLVKDDQDIILKEWDE